MEGQLQGHEYNLQCFQTKRPQKKKDQKNMKNFYDLFSGLSLSAVPKAIKENIAAFEKRDIFICFNP